MDGQTVSTENLHTAVNVTTDQNHDVSQSAGKTAQRKGRKNRARKKKSNNNQESKTHVSAVSCISDAQFAVYAKHRNAVLDVIGINTKMDIDIVHEQLREQGGEMLNVKKKVVKQWLQILTVELEELLVHVKGAIFQDPNLTTAQIVAKVRKEICNVQNEKGDTQRMLLTPTHSIVEQLRQQHKLTANDLIDTTPKDQVPKLFTIGSSDNQLADNPEFESVKEGDLGTWVPVPLNVPMMSLSSAPHQALQSFNSVREGASVLDGGELFKVQAPLQDNTAVAGTGGTAMQDTVMDLPMLMYNKARDKKTTIHPTGPHYFAIRKLLARDGTHDGTKGFLYGKQIQDGSVVHLFTEELAPAQPW